MEKQADLEDFFDKDSYIKCTRTIKNKKSYLMYALLFGISAIILLSYFLIAVFTDLEGSILWVIVAILSLMLGGASGFMLRRLAPEGCETISPKNL